MDAEFYQSPIRVVTVDEASADDRIKHLIGCQLSDARALNRRLGVNMCPDPEVGYNVETFFAANNVFEGEAVILARKKTLQLQRGKAYAFRDLLEPRSSTAIMYGFEGEGVVLVGFEEENRDEDTVRVPLKPSSFTVETPFYKAALLLPDSHVMFVATQDTTLTYWEGIGKCNRSSLDNVPSPSGDFSIVYENGLYFFQVDCNE